MNQSVPLWYNSPKEIQRLPAGIEKVLQAKGEREACKSNLLLFWGPVQSALMSSGDSAPARIGPACPTDILTDEHCRGFTGAHVGVYAHDMAGLHNHADFDYLNVHFER